MAEIRWYGHACFRLRAREATILMDPVPRSMGYKVDKQRAQIVTVSHAHPGHTATEIVSGDFMLIDAPGEYEISDAYIHGLSTFHDTQGGAEHGKNTVYLIEVEGMTFCHLGDLGHELTNEQTEMLASVDVLLVPVGGGTVLNSEQAVAVIGQIEPGIVIPMQYQTKLGDSEREPVDRFLREMAVGDVNPVDKLTLRKSDIEDGMQVMVLECSASSR